MTLADLLIPTYRNNLNMLLVLLDKAEAQLGADATEALLSARLAPDMWPLATQLRLAALQAQEAPMRLLGQQMPGPLDELQTKARNGGEHPGTLAEARARIAEAHTNHDTHTPNTFDADQPMALDLPMG